MYPLLDAENKGLAQKRLFVKLRPLRSLTAIVPALLLSVPTSGEEPRPPAQETHVDVHAFRVVESYSGPVSYYKIVEDPAEPFIRAVYRPPLETVTLGAEVPESLRQRTKRVRWKWRAQVLPKGATCGQKRNLFVVQDTVVLESGGPVGVWKTESIDPSAEFRAHFENGDPNADVPDFVGIGIMSDGDQTQSISSADYTGFILVH